MNQQSKSLKHSWVPWTILALSLIVAFILWNNRESLLKGNGTTTTTITERELRTSDYLIDSSQGITSITLEIIPKTNIKQVTLTLILLDGNGVQIDNQQKSQSNLIKGTTYQFNFSYSVTMLFKMSYYKYDVTGIVSLI